MQPVLCDNCLRTYKPYTYSETLQRYVVSGVAEWQSVDDEDSITRRYREYLKKYDTKHGDTSTKISSRFPCVKDFNICHENFNRERRKNIAATFVCFDCEEYLCAKCKSAHSKHFTFSKDDKDNMNKWDNIETKIMQFFNTEGDKKEEYIKQEQAVLCNVVDVRDSVSVTQWEFMLVAVKNVFTLGLELDSDYIAFDICILNENQTLLVSNYRSSRVKIYNISSYELIDTIELPDIPAGITEIPSTDPSQSIIAISFLKAGQIDIMNIQRRPADVISSINVQGRCENLAYCNNKLITRCLDDLDGEKRDSIIVKDMSGEIINIIGLHKDRRIYNCSSMSVHSESETIYVCHGYNSVTCLSVSGQVLHSAEYWDLIPRNICVDREQNVYVMGPFLALFKLSSDLSERVTLVSEYAANVGEVTSIKHPKNKVVMGSREGFIKFQTIKFENHLQ